MWTDERIEQLKKLWSDGLSASQIANEIGGITRNAVIGKIHRLGLSGRTKPAAASQPRQPKPRKPMAPQRSFQPQTRGNTALAPALRPEIEAAPEAAPAPVENVVPFGERCSIMTLKESSCRWPLGDPGRADFAFCGARKESGLPYCAYHARIAYQPVADRRRDRRQEQRAALRAS